MLRLTGSKLLKLLLPSLLLVGSVAEAQRQPIHQVQEVRSKTHPVYDVLNRDYGAKCDGATADTTAIQAALTAATNGGVVLIPSGVTCVTAQLTIPTGVTLRGVDKTATLKLAANTDDSLLYVNAATNVTVESLTLDGNKTNNTGTSHCFHAENGSNFTTLTDLIVKDCDDDGVRIEDNDLVLTGTTIQDAGSMGLRLSGANRFKVIGNYAVSNGASGFDVDAFSLDGLLVGNTAKDNVDNGFFIEEGSKGITVTGNTARDNLKNGFNVNQETAFEMYGVTLTGNVSNSNTQYGIRVSANVSGATVSGVVIAGNVCIDNTLDGVRVTNAAGATTRNVKVYGNLLSDYQAVPTQDYGLSITGSGTFTSVNAWNNSFYGNVSGDTNSDAIAQSSSFGIGADANITLLFDQGTGADPTLFWNDSNASFDLDPDGDATGEWQFTTTTMTGPDNDGDNALAINDNDTGTASCADDGTAGQMTLLDADSTAADDLTVCIGTTETMSVTTTYLQIPTQTDCSGVTGEAQMCWDSDDNILYVGNGATATAVGP